MPTPQEKLDAMLDSYQVANKTPTTDPGKQLREVINTTPALKATFLEQVEQGHLTKFTALPPGTPSSVLGVYRASTTSMSVSNSLLNDAGSSKQAANALRFTLGHEINHAVVHDARLADVKAFKDSVETIARGPSPHDYTATVKTFSERSRSQEIQAEIAGFNTLAGHVRSQNPRSTLKHLYEASDDMQAYIDRDKSKVPPTYTLKPGLTLDKDLTMPATRANIDAMGKHFYEANGYSQNVVDGALGHIEGVERDARAAVRAVDPHLAVPPPQISINLKELGAPGLTLPAGFTDTSHRLQAHPRDQGLAPDDSQQPAPDKHEDARLQSGPFTDAHANRYLAAMLRGDSAAMDQIAVDFSRSPQGQQMARQGDEALARQQSVDRQNQQQELAAQAPQGPVMRH